MLHVDLSNCDREPVATPGAIQPFGALLALTHSPCALTHWSANVAEVMGAAVEAARWESLFDKRSQTELRQAIAGRQAAPLRVRSASGTSVVCLLQFDADRVILELLPQAPEDVAVLAARHEDVLSLGATLESPTSVIDVCQRAMGPLRRMTGFDRVMVYRFHDDMHGEVVAEDAAAHLESWSGLHYPATDIPEPARRIFLAKKLRIIPDVSYRPVPLESVDENAPVLDLTTSLLRSVSPIHIEYLHNMRVTASMTVSLRIGGRLWGLIAFHHYSGPLEVSLATQQACATLGDYIAGAIRLQDDGEAHVERQRWKRIEAQLVGALADDPDIGRVLTRGQPSLLDLLSPQVTGAAVCDGGDWTTVGNTPPADVLNELARWMPHAAVDRVFVTDALGSHFPLAETCAEVASGVMAVLIPESDLALMWFKPEALQTVRWAGNPDKTATADSGGLHPRKSFATWQQSVVGRSMPWKQWEREVAGSFGTAVTAAQLRHRFEQERVARGLAEQANRIKEEFVSVISHDLRDPLASFSLNLLLLKKMLSGDALATVNTVLQSMDRASLQMQSLVSGLLDIAKAEQGEIDLQTEPISANDLVRECLEVLHPLTVAKRLRLLDDLPADDVMIKADRKRLLQVLSNLVGNAIKFTPEGGIVTVAVRADEERHATLSVADTGPGIPAENLAHIFDRYWRGATQGVRGVGLGLSIAKTVLDAHGSTLKVASTPGQGTTFSFALARV